MTQFTPPLIQMRSTSGHHHLRDLLADFLAYKKVAGTVIGGIYDVAVAERDAEGRPTSVYQDPAYTCDQTADDTWRALLEAAHRAHEVHAAQDRLTRRHTQDSELEDLLAPLIAISRRLRTQADRAAFNQYVTERLSR